MNKGAKIVSSAIIGNDISVIIVNHKQYVIYPPTIHKISGAINALSVSNIPDKPTLKEIFQDMEHIESLAIALSWMITGNDTIADQLKHGTLEEVINGLEESFSLISTQLFLKAAILRKNVVNLAAKPKV